MQHLVLGLTLGFATSISCPGNAVLLRHGWVRGFGPALVAGGGAVSGYAVHLCLALLGLIPLLRVAPWIAPALWFVGAAVFGALAWSAFREARRTRPLRWHSDSFVQKDGSAAFKVSSTGWGRAYLDGLAAGAGNPVNLVWWVGLLGPALEDPALFRAGLPAGILLGSLGWFCVAAVLVSFARERFSARFYRVLLFLSSAILLSFAVGFAIGGSTRILV